MAALTKDRNTRQKAGGSARTGTRGVAANAVIYLGAIIAKNAAGYVVAATDAAAVQIIGIAQQKVDNTGGANGAKTVKYATGIEAELVNASGAITVANLGRGCYVADDQSVTTRAVSVNKVYVGVVQEFTTTLVWVYIDEAIIGVLGDEQVGNVAVAGGTGIPLVATYNIADAASADYDVVVPEKIEVIDAWAQKRAANGGAANTVQVKNGANAITNAMDLNINDTTLARATTIDDAQSTIAAAGTLRFAVVKAGGNAACMAAVKYVKRA